MNIYLIGMPGCGKSTIGKKFAEKFKYNYIDMDSYIEEVNEMSIPKIFEVYGEDKFREFEKIALTYFMKLSNTIISCGGGMIKDYSNKELLNGLVIYIDVSLNDLEKRIKKDLINDRPLMKTKSVYELYEERKEAYEYFKDFTICNVNVEKAIEDMRLLL